MLERDFQPLVKEELYKRFEGCDIFKQDPTITHQGIPDLLVLYRNKWAMLETKRGFRSSKQPNQDYYVDYYNRKSFAAFINPDNYLEVLAALELHFYSA